MEDFTGKVRTWDQYLLRLLVSEHKFLNSKPCEPKCVLMTDIDIQARVRLFLFQVTSGNPSNTHPGAYPTQAYAQDELVWKLLLIVSPQEIITLGKYKIIVRGAGLSDLEPNCEICCFPSYLLRKWLCAIMDVASQVPWLEKKSELHVFWRRRSS